MAIDEALIRDVEERMAALLPRDGIAGPLYGMMRYHLGWADEELRPSRADAGKRLRVRLCLLCCQAAGTDAGRAVPPAAAVELLHNFSLIHDDIQDRSVYRRHRRTVWALWGAAQAINAGDGMLTMAQLALAEDEAADPRTAVRAIRALNRSCRLLCEGQYLDLDYENRPTVSLREYLAMIERKTASLLSTACYLGALYGGADEAALEAYAHFGRYLGLAFQMQDDYLGIWGDPAVTGKPAADDVVNKKKALPLVYALTMVQGRDRLRLTEILSRPGLASESETADIMSILEGCGAAAYTAGEVETMSETARETLALAAPEPGAEAELAALCRRLVGRTS